MKNLLISLIVSAGLMSVAQAGDAEAGKAKIGNLCRLSRC